MLFLSNSIFHLEEEIISNPSLCALRYDPCDKPLTDKRYNTKAMKTIRRGVIEADDSTNSRYLVF